MIRARQQCGAKYQMNASTFTLETCPKCPSLVCILNETVRAPAANELLGTRTVVVSCFLAYSLYLTYISIRLHDTQSGRGNVPLKLRGGPHSRRHLEILKLKILTAVHFTDMLCRLVRHHVFVSVFLETGRTVCCKDIAVFAFLVKYKNSLDDRAYYGRTLSELEIVE